MGNERKLRLIQVAKEFKVGLNTITDFLQKKGIKNDGSPNTLVDAETYAVLEKEFGANRNAGNARESVRERISMKQGTVTLEAAKQKEREEEKEVVIKSHVISVKDEIPQPKFLGKIDLNPKPKAQVAHTEPAQGAATAAAAANRPVQTAEPKAEAPKPAAPAQPAAPAAEPKVEKSEAAAPAPAPAAETAPKAVETPRPTAAMPAAQPAEAAPKAAEAAPCFCREQPPSGKGCRSGSGRGAEGQRFPSDHHAAGRTSGARHDGCLGLRSGRTPQAQAPAEGEGRRDEERPEERQCPG